MHRDYYIQARERLLQSLFEKGITNERVLTAMNTVPRELFVPEALRSRAYEDSALPIGHGQTISQPYTVAYMTQALDVRPGQKILEIGTGSGYQAAVLVALGATVFSVERQRSLFAATRKLLDDLRITVQCRFGDGTLGWTEQAPFDGIIVTAGAPDIPKPLIQQLAIGGRLVIPVGDSKSQVLNVLTLSTPEFYDIERHHQFKFVPLIGKEGWDS